jgi:hypothetical protein
MTIKPGGYDDPEQGWGGGYATESFETGSIYLAAEFVVTAGDHAKRKMWSNIGLHSKKGPTWGQMGRSFIRAALNSARNVHPRTTVRRRPLRVASRAFMNWMAWSFWPAWTSRRTARARPQRGQDRGRARSLRLRQADGRAIQGSGTGNSGAPTQAAAPAYQAPTPQRAPVTGKPSWAQ